VVGWDQPTTCRPADSWIDELVKGDPMAMCIQFSGDADLVTLRSLDDFVLLEGGIECAHPSRLCQT